MCDKRVTLCHNGTGTGGKLLLLPASIEDLLKQASEKFNTKITKIFSSTGAEIDNINVIRDDEILYISPGEDFCDRTLPTPACSDWVTLNVGGRYFTTTKITLASEPSSMLARMFAEDDRGYKFTPSNIDERGAYLIDRSPTYFEPLINYLRNGQLIYDSNLNPEGILEEARFFGVDSVIPELEKVIKFQKTGRDELPLTRRDIVDALIRSPVNAELRFQGVNLSGADLSKLDLRHINFKYANLKQCKMNGSNLSWCCLERADFSYANLDNAQLLGVKSMCANFEGAMLRNSNFEDPAGSRSNMEGSNLKGANFEGSHMAGVNLRVATLKNANLQNCDLRAAVLAGADLENCNLSGSDLHEANLRGANLKEANFKLMLTPLHMSQTVR